MTREMTGAEMVIQALADQGVEHLFGYPGGAVLPIYDAIFANNQVRHVLVRHEQGAVHAAEGYARSTGKVGCVLVTSGPGATNAVTGLTDALCDSIPLVVITAGYALFQAANNTLVMTDVRLDQRGVVSGMLNLSRNLGLITGASVMGAVFALGSATNDITTARPEAVAAGMRITFAAGAVLVTAAIAMASASPMLSRRAAYDA